MKPLHVKHFNVCFLALMKKVKSLKFRPGHLTATSQKSSLSTLIINLKDSKNSEILFTCKGAK